MHNVGEAGPKAVARPKGNPPELQPAVAARFDGQPPTFRFWNGRDYVEAWDADDFDPGRRCGWKTVRALRYSQRWPNGSVAEAGRLADFSSAEASSPALHRMAKSRWEIENQAFNEAKDHHGFGHIPHHHANSPSLHRLLILLALIVGQLSRRRYLRHGRHAPLSPIRSFRQPRLQLALSPATAVDSPLFRSSSPAFPHRFWKTLPPSPHGMPPHGRKYPHPPLPAPSPTPPLPAAPAARSSHRHSETAEPRGQLLTPRRQRSSL